jgi:hypothetical protein
MGGGGGVWLACQACRTNICITSCAHFPPQPSADNLFSFARRFSKTCKQPWTMSSRSHHPCPSHAATTRNRLPVRTCAAVARGQLSFAG